MKRILVWLSWGVDSAISAYLLKKHGYDVTAWFMINYMAPEWQYCPTKDDIIVARNVAEYLKIPFFLFDYRKEYEEKVLNYMYEWYKKWITPNPDIMCNSEIKFKIFLDEALEIGYDMVATWHYAQIFNTRIPLSWLDDNEEKYLYHLKKWVDKNKDQSYFLAWLNQHQLSHSLFPIWAMRKEDVRKMALEIGLPNALRKDSQGICFVWKVNLREFLEQKIEPKMWNVLDTSWKIIWVHSGVYYYTVWQRKWLDIWWQAEWIYVVWKNIERNEIIVWTKDDIMLYDDMLFIEYMHFLAWDDFLFPLKVKCKIRYRQEDQDCEIFKLKDLYKIVFKEKQRAIASWQIVAVYINDELVMSGVIK